MKTIVLILSYAAEFTSGQISLIFSTSLVAEEPARDLQRWWNWENQSLKHLEKK